MKLSGRSWIALIIASVIMLTFLSVQSALVFKYIEPTYKSALFGYWSIIAFMPFFYFVVIEFVRKARHKFQSIDDTFNASRPIHRLFLAIGQLLPLYLFSILW